MARGLEGHDRRSSDGLGEDRPRTPARDPPRPIQTGPAVPAARESVCRPNFGGAQKFGIVMVGGRGEDGFGGRDNGGVDRIVNRSCSAWMTIDRRGWTAGSGGAIRPQPPPY